LTTTPYGKSKRHRIHRLTTNRRLAPSMAPIPTATYCTVTSVNEPRPRGQLAAATYADRLS
jgi:hypothetical protein